MEPNWASLKRGVRFRLSTALLGLLIAAPPAGCATLQNDWSVTVRGVVLDSETKLPIPHATLLVDRDPSSTPDQTSRERAARDRGQRLTAGSNGHFAISGIAFGSHFFNAAKDGYISATIRSTLYQLEATPLFSTYEVQVGPTMGEIRLFLTPAAKIQGRVISESGQPMKNVYLTLYHGVVEDGRTMWQRARVLGTDAKGFYSFPDLAPGSYVVLSDWIFDNDPDPPHGSDCGATNFKPTGGFPPAANPGVLDFSAAQPIRLAAGHVETANLKLPHREFQTVTWIHNSELSPRSFRTLRDRNGRNLQMVSPPESHCGRFMPETLEKGSASPPENALINGRETIRVPDGDYTLLTGSGFPKDERESMSTLPRLGYYAHFAVAGKPLTLSYPNRPARSEPAVTFHIQCDRIANEVPCKAEDVAGSALWLTHADPLPEFTRPIVLNRSRDSKWVFYLEAGSYWVHTGDLGSAYAPADSCVTSVTAGGADMSREALVVGLDGKGPQLQVTTSRHCGIVHLNYAPPNPNQERYGVSRPFYGYLVPMFSAFETVHSFLFVPGRPQQITVGRLVPGHYQFYVAPHQRSFAFRETRDVAPDLGPGQDVWLKPDEKVDVSVVEPPEE